MDKFVNYCRVGGREVKEGVALYGGAHSGGGRWCVGGG